jgi:hypothetical protein
MVGKLGNVDVEYWPRHMTGLAEVTRDTLYQDLARSIFADVRATDRLTKADARIVTIGSCFAQNISNWLVARGFACKNVRVEEGVNSIRGNLIALMQGEGPGTDVRREIRQANFVVLTLGVSLIPIYRETGDYCSAKNLKELIGTGTVSMKMLSVAETVADLTALIGLIRSDSPGIRIVLTLSPVPLSAAVGASVFAQDCISKSVLRAAINEVLGITYWPTYELYKHVVPHIPPEIGFSTFGTDDANSRHPSRWLMEKVFADFEAIFFD